MKTRSMFEFKATCALFGVALAAALTALAPSCTGKGSAEPAKGMALPDAVIGPFEGTIFGGWRLGEDRVAVETFDSQATMLIYNVRDKSKPLLVNSRPCPVVPPTAVAVTSSRLAWATGHDLMIVDAATGKTTFKFPLQFQDGSISAVARCESTGLVAWIEEPDHPFPDPPDPGEVLVRVADCMTGELVLDMKVKRFDSHQTFDALSIAPDGSSLIFTNTTCGVFSWCAIDLKSKGVLWNLKRDSPAVRTGVPGAIVYHPDGLSFFSGTGTVDRTDILTGKSISSWGPVTYKGYAAIDRLILNPRPVTSTVGFLAMDVSPDGKYVAVDTDGIYGTIIFDVATGKEYKRIRTTQWPVEQPLFFSADSKGIWVAGTQDKELRYFKVGP